MARTALGTTKLARNQGIAAAIVVGLATLLEGTGHGLAAIVAAPIAMAVLTWIGSIVRDVAMDKWWAKYLP
ncbi:hypothetical protein LCGC14_1764730 [marine sediment metagenome]|uniref:Uncharacterized protein n=1 Tax=marine sediment metagenome TaxID=412755 RepID=A0A0F9H014_9ZZZZ